MTDKKTALRNLLANLAPVISKLDWVSSGEGGLDAYANLLNNGIYTSIWKDPDSFHVHMLNRYPTNTAPFAYCQVEFKGANQAVMVLRTLGGTNFWQGGFTNNNAEPLFTLNGDVRRMKSIVRNGTSTRYYTDATLLGEETRTLAPFTPVPSSLTDTIAGMPTLFFAWGHGAWTEADQQVLLAAVKQFKFDLLGNTERPIVNSYAELLLEDVGTENRDIMVLNDESVSDVNMVYTLFTNGTLVLQPKSYLPDVPTKGPKSFLGNRSIPDTNNLPVPYYETLFGSQLAGRTERTERFAGMRVPVYPGSGGYPSQWVQFYVDTPFGFIGMAGQFLPNGMLQLLRGLDITGTATAPTPASTDNSTLIATTAFVKAVLAGLAPLANPTFTGVVTVPALKAVDPAGGKIILQRDDVDVIAGEEIGSIDFATNDGSSNAAGVVGRIRIVASQNFSAQASPPGSNAAMAFHPNYGAAGTLTEAMRINPNGSLSIGTSTPEASARLDVVSTTQGVLLPRMTTAQRNAITAPARGLHIFNLDTDHDNIYTSSGWRALAYS